MLHEDDMEKCVFKPQNGYVTPQNGNSVISRDDKLMLVPDPPKVAEDNLSDDENIKHNDLNKVSPNK